MKPSLENLSMYFAHKGQAGRESTVLNEASGVSYVSCLDDDITTEEIHTASKPLKEDKSSGDGWTRKMITSMPFSLLLILQMIFNCILKHHVFSRSWRL